ncbi:hypothetical protein [Kitasatospora sp. NPDC059571]|uniref:hypothetical protein n=1 Tax=Kitasatospora sp. NPDC059571 TaxID=3346871 RepID=UPI0036A2CC53
MTTAAARTTDAARPTPRIIGTAPPTETPECESSTGHGISIPEAVELRTAWPGWAPVLAIAVMVLCTVGFMVARIAAW